MAVGKLELGVVLNLVEEDDLAVGHQTSVHSRDTGAALDLDSSRLDRCGSRAGLGSSNSGCVDTRTRLATFTAVSSRVSTISVHRATGSLSPGAADHVGKGSATASIGSLDASGGGGGGIVNVGRLSEDGLAGGGGRGRTGNVSSSSSGLGGGSILAAVLAAIGDGAVAILWRHQHVNGYTYFTNLR